MYKFIAVDMDGTLLNSKGEIDPLTKKAILAAKKRGVLVTISTGRPIQGVRKYIQELEITAPVITYNGAVIVDPKKDQILYQKGLSKEDARQVIEEGLSRKVSLILWAKNALYVNRIDENVKKYQQLSGNTPIIVENYDKIIELGITKILWIDEADTIKKYREALATTIRKSVHYCTSKTTFLEFFDAGVSKADALEYIRKEYRMSRQEMIAIGDGYNDLSMIEYAGLGVAMGNAESGVKRRADFVTKSNDENGIAHVINRFVIQRV